MLCWLYVRNQLKVPGESAFVMQIYIDPVSLGLFENGLKLTASSQKQSTRQIKNIYRQSSRRCIIYRLLPLLIILIYIRIANHTDIGDSKFYRLS